MVVLSLWMAPGAAALAVGLHLSFGHHHSHGDHDHGSAHPVAAIELALAAAVHGHDHGAGAVPDHEHSAPVTGATTVQPKTSITAGPIPHGSAPEVLSAALERPPCPRRGPPAPLFEAHCSLLL